MNWSTDPVRQHVAQSVTYADSENALSVCKMAIP